jgi:hypothetical protein
MGRLQPLGLIGALIFAASLAGPVLAQGPGVDFTNDTHFRCYIVSQQTPQPATAATLTDQFFTEGVDLTIDEPLQLCAPTAKNGVPLTSAQEEQHLTMYPAAEELGGPLIVYTEDQFGERTLEVVGARVLLVPTVKDNAGDLGDLEGDVNHYWCYEANGPKVNQTVTLDDQFSAGTVTVLSPSLFCNPVEKTTDSGTIGIVDEELHLTSYDLRGKQKTQAQMHDIENQFETDVYTITSWQLLCVPAEKIGWEPA